MDNKERQVFDAVIEKFKEQYPHRDIEIETNAYHDAIVMIDHRPQFNITGYNLLFNLQRLCNCLDGELI
jgi:hypothetical protein